MPDAIRAMIELMEGRSGRGSSTGTRTIWAPWTSRLPRSGQRSRSAFRHSNIETRSIPGGRPSPILAGVDRRHAAREEWHWRAATAWTR